MRIRTILTKIIEYGFYALFFVTPLVFNPSRILPSFELFEWNKMVVVYVLTSLIVGAWLGLMIVDKKVRLRRTPFDIPLLLFLGSAVLSTIFSIDPHVSFFGYYSRFHGGLLSTISYTLLYYAFVNNMELVNLPQLFLYALASGTVVALYGIAERFGIDASMWVQDVRARVFSTLGQPNWLAALLVVIFPLSIISLLRTYTLNVLNKWSFKRAAISTISWGLIGIVFYICLLFTKSRSGFLAFYATFAFFWGIVYFRSTNKKYIVYFLGISVIVLFLLNFFIKTPFEQYNKYATVELLTHEQVVVETTPPVGDSVINIGITDSAVIRRIVWKGALDIAKNYPLFGTGPETFAFAYYKYRPVEHNLTSEWDFLYNRAHNEFLNIAATQGFLGLGLYIFLIGIVFFWGLAHFVFKWKNTSVTAIALLAAYVSIWITNFFGFSVVIIGLYFYLIPAFLVALRQEKMVPMLHEMKVSRNQWISLGVVGIIVFICLGTISMFWFADTLYAQSTRFARQKMFNEAHPLIIEATKLRPDEPVYHDERSTTASNLALQSFATGNATITAELMREAVDESSRALKISPQNVNFWKSRTRMFFAFATIDDSFIDESIKTIEIARELAPTDPNITYNYAVALGRRSRNQEAIAMLQKTIMLKPDYRDAYVALAIFYQDEKQIDKARDILNEALKKVNPNDEEIKKRLLDLGKK